MGRYVAVRGWLECDDRQLERIREIVADPHDDRNGAGWAFPDVPYGWTSYAFFGADVRAEDIGRFLDQLRAIAALPASLPDDGEDGADPEDGAGFEDGTGFEDNAGFGGAPAARRGLFADDHELTDPDEDHGDDPDPAEHDEDEDPDEDEDAEDHGDRVVGFFLATPEDDVTGAVEWRVRDGGVQSAPAGDRYRYLDE
ncbi:hypothetical protein [Streptoalloteichus hindustanus]|uniref:Uncharacterized protein n=1 Tax=Streptoalloteichus hindustanus TaxID=2017 RepID=A0A1M5B510_STRHI|nr:hypothetical protein [Streptoalloteichus hindustanus]SHF37559.1 hypothetical protein SAMN05444320_103402 [Streptoalloteichus hindustanus]